MSNIDRNVDYSDFTTALKFVLKQWSKGLYTGMPGIVEKYDPNTRRATVQPAIKIQLTDDQIISRAPLVNCPVVWTATGRYSFTMDLLPGDPVFLFFSMRGMTEFKETFMESDPDAGHIMNMNDAVALPGFGPLEITPASTDGPSLQSTDGTLSIHVEGEDLFINIPSGNVNINVSGNANVNIGGIDGQELVTKTFLERYHNQHIHSTSMGPSGPPIVPSPVAPSQDITKKTKAE